MKMNDKASLSELLQWLEGGARTYDWSAVLAYDRDRTNVVLRQEYIERFDAGSYLPPCTELIPTGDGTAEYVHDYVFDAARLSFINASIDDSRALLSQQVIGGAQLSLRRSALGATQVEKIFSLDALDGPRLESGILLAESTGYVNLAGKVVLDISAGVLPRLLFAGSEAERERCGLHFLRDFGDLPADKRILVLNELVSGAGFMQPVSFELRTHAAPNNRVRGTPAYGAGAVLVFITLLGESNGTSPVRDDDMPFLIPAGHSATLLMGQAFFVQQILVRAGQAASYLGVPFQYELFRDGNRLVRQIRVTSAATPPLVRSGFSPVYDLLRVPHMSLNLAGRNSYSVLIDKGGFTLVLNGDDMVPMEVKPRDGAIVRSDVQMLWSVRRRYTLRIYPATGGVGLAVDFGDSYMNFWVSPGHFVNHPPINDRFQEVADFGKACLLEAFNKIMSTVVETCDQLDSLRLNNLLFRGDNALTLRSAHLPGDVALFGDVSPGLSDFMIQPLEPIMGPGQTQRFGVLPPRWGVVWSLHGLPGEEVALGSITQDGIYTAPQLGEISGYQVRVKVRATLGGHSSTALVTVVVRDVTVNPVVQVCDTRQVRHLSAGALGDGPLTWAIADPGSGSSIASAPDPDGFHLFRPGALDLFTLFRVDEVVVSNTSTGNRQSAWVLVIGGTPSLEIRYVEVPGQPDQVQCTAYFAINGQPADPASLGWRLIVGAGHIDDDGLFTMDRHGQMRFAVITCQIFMPPPLPSYTGFCILPLPLVALPELMNVLGDAAALFSGQGAHHIIPHS